MDESLLAISDPRDFGIAAHRSINQLRPHSDEPYEVHLAEVAALVKSVPHTSAMLAAAWTHDCRDDVPGVTVALLAKKFGTEAAQIVDDLSDHEKGLGNRRRRKAAERERIANCSGASQTVRLADVISNVRTIVQRNPTFAAVYVPEKAELVKVLVKGDPTLLALAHQTIDTALRELAVLKEQSKHG